MTRPASSPGCKAWASSPETQENGGIAHAQTSERAPLRPAAPGIDRVHGHAAGNAPPLAHPWGVRERGGAADPAGAGTRSRCGSRLNDSRAAAELARRPPAGVHRHGASSGFGQGRAPAPAALVTDEETTREYEVGDFGYWPPGPDLAIFYDDFYEQTVVPIIPVGHAESGAEDLWDAYGTVRMELVPLEEEGDGCAAAVALPHTSDIRSMQR